MTSARFLAACFVVLYHLGPQVWWLHQGYTGRVVALGYTSVPFFFVLSGFVLALAYLRQNRPVDTRKFLTARFARIYPALFVWLTFDLPHFLHAEIQLNHHPPRQIVGEILISYAGLEAWFPRTPLIDVPSWSIAAEFFFYFLFPWIAPPLWRLAARKMAWTALCLFLAENLAIALLTRPGIDSYRIEWIPISHLAEFLIGICLAKWYLGTSQDAVWSERLRRTAPLAILVAVLAFLAIPFFAPGMPEPYLQHGILIPIHALLILGLASGNRIVARLFSAGWFVLLGEASFALYLLHMPLMMVFRRQFEVSPIVFPLIFFPLAVGLSVFSFVYLETPARRYILARAHIRSRESVTTQAIAQ